MSEATALKIGFVQADSVAHKAKVADSLILLLLAKHPEGLTVQGIAKALVQGRTTVLYKLRRLNKLGKLKQAKVLLPQRTRSKLGTTMMNHSVVWSLC